MQRRYGAILTRLQANIATPGSGAGVPQTIDHLRSLFDAVDTIRTDHFRGMTQAEQLSFFDLLVGAFDRLVDDTDLFAQTMAPSYAGQGFQSHRSLFSSFLAAQGQPLYFIDTLLRFGEPMLCSRQGQIRGIVARAVQLCSRHRQGSPDQAMLNGVLQTLHRLSQGMSEPITQVL